MGSPRHQTPTSQQSPLHKSTTQQGPKPVQPQSQKTQTRTGVGGPATPTSAKQPTDTKTTTPAAAPVPTTEAQKQMKPTEEKPKTEPENQTAKETKPSLKKGEQITPVKEIKKSRQYDDTKNNSTHDLSRSPQSLSDTGYSSDGISSSHSEITGLIQEEEMKLSERGISGRGSPPSPSEITKLEFSMRPLLEKSLSEEKPDRRGRKHRDRDLDDRGKHRPRSLSIPPDAYDSDEELEDILEEEEDGGDWEEIENDIYEEIRQTSQNITKMQQATDEQVDIEIESSFADKQLLDTGSAFAKLLEQSNALLTPGTSPTQISAPVSFAESGGRIPDVRISQHFTAKDGHKDRIKSQAGKNGITPTVAATTIAAYGVYARDAVTISQTGSSHTMTTSQSDTSRRHTGSLTTSSATVSSVCSKIAEITQAYSQREVITRRIGETRGVQVRESSTSSAERIIEPRSPKYTTYYRSTSPPLSPSPPPPQSPICSPSRRATAEFSTQTFSSALRMESADSWPTSPVMAQGTQTAHRSISPRLYRQQSSQEAPYSPPAGPARPMTVNTATSPLSSPTRFSRQSTFDNYSPCGSPPDTPPYQQSPTHSFYQTQRVEKVNVGTSMVTTASLYTRGSVSMDNISLCRISTVPGTSRVEQGHMIQGGSVVDLRTATHAAPYIMTDQGMDLTSLATESRKYHGGPEGARHSTIIQPLIMNLNTQETSAPTTVSVTVAASMFMTQLKQPVVYGDPHQNRIDLGLGMGSAVCLSQNKSPISPPTDPSIPKIDAKLEDLSVQQRELQKQQEKLQKQQELLEQQLQQHHQLQQHQQQASVLAKYNLTGQISPLTKTNVLVSQTSTASTVVSAVSPVINPELYGTGPIELKGKPSPPGLMSGGKSPHSMVVQMDGGPEPVRALTQLVKVEEGQDAMDLTGGQIKPDQPACCDVVYRLPFGGSCVGVPEKEGIRPPSAPPITYECDQERQPGRYHEYPMDSRKAYTLPFPGKLQSSMSDTNLADAELQSYHSKYEPHLQPSGELVMDLTAMKQSYGGYVGMQYGSYTDLRHGGDISAQTLPIRRYNSLSNISSDYGYSARDIASFQEANLAQYSATTAREISRMCAALNSMDRYGSNPELLQFGSLGRGIGPGASRLAAGLGMRQSVIFGLDGKPMSQNQALTNLINARQASLRAMYPAAIRSSDGMIYSTIQTPIASTLPITTQPGSVLRPLLRGVYRPYASPNMTPVPLASLTRLPVSPRIPLTGQAPLRYPAPGLLQTTSATASTTAAASTSAPGATLVPVSLTTTSSTVQEEPVYLGKGAKVTAEVTSAQGVIVSESQHQPINLSQTHLNTQQKQQTTTQHPQPPLAAHVYPTSSPAITQGYIQPAAGPSVPTSGLPIPCGLPPFPPPGVIHKEGETEAERLHRQQEQLLQMERERVELEKLRQLRLQEELERERIELKFHREKEQILVQRELQELHNIKEQLVVLEFLTAFFPNRSTDDDEDKAETEHPVRRRRSRFSRHSESTAAGTTTASTTTTATDTKGDTSKIISSSIAVQTIREVSCQTEVEHLGRVSPAIHVTLPDPNKVEIVHYISGPERTQKGQSLACQTDPEGQSQGVVAPQLSVPTTVSPYSSCVGTGPSSSVDFHTQQRQQQHVAANAAKFERRRPDPLDINYQPHNHLHNESISSIIRQQQTTPKSPQVLYSPVSPVSPHRLLETSLSSERLNKAHVTPQQKSYTAESPQRHPSVPRPIKSTHRSMSDPKSLSPTTDEHTKARLSLYQQQALQSQVKLLKLI
ncbi:hypothetical protein XENOCAPTIV_003234 [Xenoophorus captivus]|uniref:Protein piccolo-like n=1 Tax=Xenoophorus captivus TaxID=1517983 RepID=A0ABV0QM51_9TELE